MAALGQGSHRAVEAALAPAAGAGTVIQEEHNTLKVVDTEAGRKNTSRRTVAEAADSKTSMRDR